MSENSGVDFVTQIPGLADVANIQTALKEFLYGSVSNASAAEGTLAATDGTEGLVGHLNNMQETMIPAGVVWMWSGTSANVPDGWLLCNGSTFDAGAYPALNTHFGGNTLPDLTDKFIKGASTSGTTGGTDTIGTSQLPAHNHSVTVNSDNAYHGHGNTGGQSVNHTHADHSLAVYQYQAGSNQVAMSPYTNGTATGTESATHVHAVYGANATHSHTASSGNVGSGNTIEPLFYTLCYIVKA